MLVERGVVDSRGQQDDAGVGASAGGEVPQRLAQHGPVMFHLPHPVAPVEAAQAPLHHLAVGDHVGHARRHPQVVLEHLEAVVGPHQIGAANRDPRTVGYGDPAHLDTILGTAAHHVGRDHAVGDDAGLAVDVLQKPVQGADALGEAGFEPPPLDAREDAGHAVDGDDALIGLVVAVDRERDAFVREGACDPLLHAAQLVAGEPPQGVVQRPAVRAGRAVGQEHLVVDRSIEIVAVEVHRDDPSGGSVAAGRRRKRRSAFGSGRAHDPGPARMGAMRFIVDPFPQSVPQSGAAGGMASSRAGRPDGPGDGLRDPARTRQDHSRSFCPERRLVLVIAGLGTFPRSPPRSRRARDRPRGAGPPPPCLPPGGGGGRSRPAGRRRCPRG